MKKKSRLSVYKQHWPLYLMMLPGLLYLLINNYIPMGGIVIAFKKLNFAKGIFASPWCGLDNFKFLFQSKDAWIITRNTLLYNVAFIAVNMIVGIAVAILICEVRSNKMKKIYQSAILLPFLMSMVILSYIVYALLSSENGLINNTILNAMSGTHHYHPASVKYRTYFLFGFRPVLSGAYEFRGSLSDDQCDRHLCVQSAH